MKLPLDDEIWTRLYGPYGNRPVNESIAKLAVQWDHAIASELLWEDLHHQDDIYPTTFAALPWLLDIAPKSGKGFEDVQLFFSHVVFCAVGEVGGKPKGTYRGLSTDLRGHRHAWLSEDEWLRESDLSALLRLEEWFSENSAKIALDCLSLVGPDLTKSAYAMEGFATLEGSMKVALAAQMFADGEGQGLIKDEIGFFDEADARVVEALRPHIEEKSKAIMAFLAGFPQDRAAPHSS